MPNWTYNTFRVSGSKQNMREFYDLAIKPNVNDELSFSFSNVFPMPEKIKNTISPSSSALGRKWMNENLSTKRNEKLSGILDEEEDHPELIPVENNSPEKCESLKKEFGADNWYDWNLHKYGTKWDVESLVSDSVKDDGLFECQFDTAWSPPSNFLSNLQNKFPKLDIKLIFELEGSDECGIFITDRSGDEVTLVYEQDEVTYIGSDGREIYYDNKDGEWHYHDDDEVCEDYMQVNPFYEN